MPGTQPPTSLSALLQQGLAAVSSLPLDGGKAPLRPISAAAARIEAGLRAAAEAGEVAAGLDLHVIGIMAAAIGPGLRTLVATAITRDDVDAFVSTLTTLLSPATAADRPGQWSS